MKLQRFCDFILFYSQERCGGIKMKGFDRVPLYMHSMPLPRGQVYLILERCKGCGLCIHFCPRQVLQESPGANAKGYHYPQLAPGKETACIHCEFCSLICPEFAIFTREVTT